MKRQERAREQREATVRPGPRFTDETTEETTRRMQESAVRLVNRRGFGSLNFRALAESEDPPLTRTAPLYYFGTTAGLIAAVAESGFDNLVSELTPIRKSGEPSAQTLRDLAMAYGEYALRHPHLYRAMHAPELWHQVTALQQQPRRAMEDAERKADRWIQQAWGSRDAAFKQFELAVEAAEAGGELDPDPKEYKGASARLLTAIVDGFLFHRVAEQVGAEKPMKRLLGDLGILLDRALTGLLRKSGGGRSIRTARGARR
jgi:AcrR family transcriptional regulator